MKRYTKNRNRNKAISVSLHAAQRAKERVGVGKSSVDRLAELAYQRGYHHAHTKGALFRWIKYNVCKRGVDDPRIYGEKLYLFNHGVLVTVIPLPGEFLSCLPKFLRKKRKEGKKSMLSDETMEKTVRVSVVNQASAEGSDYKPGEIWTFRNSAGDTRECLIVAVHKRYCSVLTLSENASLDSNLEILSKKMMHADAGKVSFVFNDKLDQFLRVLGEDDFAVVHDAVREALGFVVPKMDSSADSVSPSLPVTEEDAPGYALMKLARCESELEVYKRLYAELLEKCLRAAS